MAKIAITYAAVIGAVLLFSTTPLAQAETLELASGASTPIIFAATGDGVVGLQIGESRNLIRFDKSGSHQLASGEQLSGDVLSLAGDGTSATFTSCLSGSQKVPHLVSQLLIGPAIKSSTFLDRHCGGTVLDASGPLRLVKRVFSNSCQRQPYNTRIRRGHGCKQVRSEAIEVNDGHRRLVSGSAAQWFSIRGTRVVGVRKSNLIVRKIGQRNGSKVLRLPKRSIVIHADISHSGRAAALVRKPSGSRQVVVFGPTGRTTTTVPESSTRVDMGAYGSKKLRVLVQADRDLYLTALGDGTVTKVFQDVTAWSLGSRLLYATGKNDAGQDALFSISIG